MPPSAFTTRRELGDAAACPGAIAPTSTQSSPPTSHAAAAPAFVAGTGLGAASVASAAAVAVARGPSTSAAAPPASSDARSPDERATRDLSAIRRALWLLAALALVALATAARAIVVPLLFALIVSMALYPVVRRLARLGIPRPLGAALVVLLLAGAGWAAIDAAGEPLGAWAAKLPNVVQTLRTEIGRVQRAVTQPAVRDVPLKQVRVRESDKPKIEAEQVVSLAGGVAGPLRAALLGVAVTLALAYFMLATGARVLATAIALLPAHALRCNLRRLGRAIQQALVRYLGAVTMINIGLGLAVAAMLAALGLPGALFLGAVVAVMNFLPFVGAAVSAVALTLAALTTFGVTAQALAVPLGFLALHLLEAQFVTPYVIGRTLTLNPLFVIVSVVVFGTGWGIGGAFLAVPLLVIAKVSFDAVPHLRGWGQILGRRRGFDGGVVWLEGRRRARERRRARPATPPAT